VSAETSARYASAIGKRVYAVLLSLLLSATAPEGAASNAPPAWADFAFPVGEELVYRVYWGFIPVGKTRIVTRWVEENGRKLLAIRYRARSNRVLAAIYPVDDIVEAVVDPVSFRPVRFVKNLKEGSHRNQEVTLYDFEKGTAHWESRTKNKSRDYPVEEDTRDLVTFMYFVRGQRFEEGTNRRFRVSDDDKLYDLTVKAYGEEPLELQGFGKVKCMKLEPVAEFQGLFVRKGRMLIWIVQGERCIVTRVVASLPVANVRAVLSEVHGPGDDFWIRQTRENLKGRPKEEDPEVDKAMRELD